MRKTTIVCDECGSETPLHAELAEGMPLHGLTIVRNHLGTPHVAQQLGGARSPSRGPVDLCTSCFARVRAALPNVTAFELG